jgi:hypothetical protein
MMLRNEYTDSGISTRRRTACAAMSSASVSHTLTPTHNAAQARSRTRTRRSVASAEPSHWIEASGLAASNARCSNINVFSLCTYGVLTVRQ